MWGPASHRSAPTAAPLPLPLPASRICLSNDLSMTFPSPSTRHPLLPDPEAVVEQHQRLPALHLPVGGAGRHGAAHALPARQHIQRAGGSYRRAWGTAGGPVTLAHRHLRCTRRHNESVGTYRVDLLQQFIYDLCRCRPTPRTSWPLPLAARTRTARPPPTCCTATATAAAGPRPTCARAWRGWRAVGGWPASLWRRRRPSSARWRGPAGTFSHGGACQDGRKGVDEAGAAAEECLSSA